MIGKRICILLFLLLSLLFVGEIQVFVRQYVKRNFQDFIRCLVIFKAGVSNNLTLSSLTTKASSYLKRVNLN